jgi:hypothetical protein
VLGGMFRAMWATLPEFNLTQQMDALEDGASGAALLGASGDSFPRGPGLSLIPLPPFSSPIWAHD